jgi:chorismate dehydratase
MGEAPAAVAPEAQGAAGGLRVARLPYLNCDPYYLGFGEAASSLPAYSPADLGQAAREGLVDAGPLSLVDAWSLEGEFQPLGELGIAAARRVRSVALFSRRPLSELEGACIAVTSETATSVIMLKTLLEGRYGVSSTLVRESDPQAEAKLLIGDRALVASERGLAGFPIFSDLVAEWWAWRREPFVFARWMVRAGVSVEAEAGLLAALEAGLNTWRARLPEIVAVRESQLGLHPNTISDYLNQFHYRLGPAELAAEAAFRQAVAA